MVNKLENLPNEILLIIFEYFDLQDLLNGFWQLNIRFNQLIQLINNFSLIIKNDQSKIINIFSNKITRLVINTLNDLNFQQFYSLHSLILQELTHNQFIQLRSKFFPQLNYLSISSILSNYTLMPELTQRIFSNEFSTLYHVKLGCIYVPFYFSWSQSPYLKSLSIHCTESLLISYILYSCPNLFYLKINFIHNEIRFCQKKPIIYNHPLKIFILIDSCHELYFEDIDIFLSYMHQIQRLNLEFFCDILFINCIKKILNQLKYLKYFDCHIEVGHKNTLTTIKTIQEMHSCFKRIRYIENLQTFTTRTN